MEVEVEVDHQWIKSGSRFWGRILRKKKNTLPTTANITTTTTTTCLKKFGEKWWKQLENDLSQF